MTSLPSQSSRRGTASVLARPVCKSRTDGPHLWHRNTGILSEAPRARYGALGTTASIRRNVQKTLDIFFFFDKISTRMFPKGGEIMGIFVNCLFINAEQRFKDGKTDGYNVLVAVDADAYRIKITDELYNTASVGSLCLGDHITCSVSINAFRDKIYFSAISLEVVEA